MVYDRAVMRGGLRLGGADAGRRGYRGDSDGGGYQRLAKHGFLLSLFPE
jgi:hypothetical protein